MFVLVLSWVVVVVVVVVVVDVCGVVVSQKRAMGLNRLHHRPQQVTFGKSGPRTKRWYLLALPIPAGVSTP